MKLRGGQFLSGLAGSGTFATRGGAGADGRPLIDLNAVRRATFSPKGKGSARRSKDLGGGFAGRFEFTGEELWRREAGLGLVVGDGLEA